ncbi:restriction endonuclease subunit S [Anaerobiospirillum succiniciproducens]|uniref:restriction endonuclease subunit S n=1 Tax=Anaerobiospirillum succiniciproducens TaxID=13335 RepID=UPI002941E749|nr:restriction endonuclease subunit S [Anaerobiospirillum succiniciproducens]
MIFKRMREQILDKAIRGQLVPQLAEDGVVEQIGEAPAEVPFEIPQSWKWGTLENYVTINPSTSKLDDNKEVSFLPMASVYPGFVSKFDREESKLWVNAKKGFSKFANGDVLLAKISPCFENRKSCIVHNLINGFGAGSTELIAMRPTELIYANYLLWYVKTKYVIDYCSITFKGTVGQQRINPDRFKSMPIPVPPLAEQKRIASKIESLFGEIDCAEKAYEELQSLANVLKSQILQKAIQGKLVPQLPEDGVVEQIGKTPSEVPFDIPDSWKWVKFEHTCNCLDSMRVPIKQKERENLNKQYPYYGATGVIDYVDKYIFDGSFLLIGEDGANLLSKSKDNAFIATGKFWVNNHAHIFDSNNVSELNYLAIVINAMHLNRYVTGSAQPKLTQKNLFSIPVPLPPLAEQKRIVAKVEALFEQIDLMTK